MPPTLAPGVYHLDLGMVNAYLVDDRDTGVDDPGVTLVDTGTPWKVGTLESELEAAGYAVDDVDRVLLTHYDLDHVGGLVPLGIDSPVYAMDPDASFLDGFEKPPIRNHKGLTQRALGVFLQRPERPVTRLSDGESIGGFVAHHTPGHTPGHTVFVHEALSAAFLGDMVFGGDSDDTGTGADGGLDASPWYVCYDTKENAESIRSFADSGVRFDVAAMGHGDPLKSGGDRALERLASRLD